MSGLPGSPSGDAMSWMSISASAAMSPSLRIESGWSNCTGSPASSVGGNGVPSNCATRSTNGASTVTETSVTAALFCSSNSSIALPESTTARNR